MSKTIISNLDLHLNEAEFRAAIEYTSRDTGFRSEFIEKDYYCSVLLAYLFSNAKSPLIFRGGTGPSLKCTRRTG